MFDFFSWLENLLIYKFCGESVGMTFLKFSYHDLNYMTFYVFVYICNRDIWQRCPNELLNFTTICVFIRRYCLL